jgi:hypothetical protein
MADENVKLENVEEDDDWTAFDLFKEEIAFYEQVLKYAKHTVSRKIAQRNLNEWKFFDEVGPYVSGLTKDEEE